MQLLGRHFSTRVQLCTSQTKPRVTRFPCCEANPKRSGLQHESVLKTGLASTRSIQRVHRSACPLCHYDFPGIGECDFLSVNTANCLSLPCKYDQPKYNEIMHWRDNTRLYKYTAHDVLFIRTVNVLGHAMPSCFCKQSLSVCCSF